jgi:hypothetical protein
MQTFGSDRTRTAGGKVILQSSIPKGWTPRAPKTSTSAEFPGTAVLWEEQQYEVLEATPLPTGGVRYVLAPWRDEHTIRTFERYDEESEAQRHADAARVRRQRSASVVSRLSGVFLGHLPAPVQEHLRDELGVDPARMTLLSCLLPLTAVGICVWLYVDASMKQTSSPVPLWLWLLLGLMLPETGVRFFVAMSQSRGMGSFVGGTLYLALWSLMPKRAWLPSPLASRGERLNAVLIQPAEDVALRDSLEMKGPLLTLLTPAEQHELARRYGFDYRRHAFGFTWGILIVALLGVVTSYMKLSSAPTLSAFLSICCAAAVALEQIARLVSLRRGPAGSVFGALVRPFVRELFTARN